MDVGCGMCAWRDKLVRVVRGSVRKIRLRRDETRQRDETQLELGQLNYVAGSVLASRLEIELNFGNPFKVVGEWNFVGLGLAWLGLAWWYEIGRQEEAGQGTGQALRQPGRAKKGDIRLVSVRLDWTVVLSRRCRLQRRRRWCLARRVISRRGV
jgi:hypothetical protein